MLTLRVEGDSGVPSYCSILVQVMVKGLVKVLVQVWTDIWFRLTLSLDRHLVRTDTWFGPTLGSDRQTSNSPMFFVFRFAIASGLIVFLSNYISIVDKGYDKLKVLLYFSFLDETSFSWRLDLVAPLLQSGRYRKYYPIAFKWNCLQYFILGITWFGVY